MLVGILVALVKLVGVYLLITKVLVPFYKRWQYYGQPGLRFVQSVPLPFVGDIAQLGMMIAQEPSRPQVAKWIWQCFGDEDNVPPAVGIQWPYGFSVNLTDSDLTHDLFQTYNDQLTKHSNNPKLFSSLMWNAFPWIGSEEPSYKPRRKLVSHAFYASKLKAISDLVYGLFSERLDKWPEVYPDGKLDLIKELGDLNGSIVLASTLGPENADMKLPYTDYDTGKTEMTHLGTILNRLITTAVNRGSQLHTLLFVELMPYCLSPQDRVYSKNVQVVTDFVKKIIAQRRVEIKEGKIGVDLLSIILHEGTEVYDIIKDPQLREASIIDDITAVYLAASVTIQIATNNLMKYVHMDQYKPVLKKLLDEVDSEIPFPVWDAQGQRINQDKMREACSYQNLQENFDYLVMGFKESLRIEPPVSYTSAYAFKKDIVLAKGTNKEVKVRAGDLVHILPKQLHHDRSQWGDSVKEFIPERFDPSNKLSRTPEGKPRSPHAFAPFFGGHRICPGKTFAEVLAKKTISMMLKIYTFEHSDEKMKTETFDLDISAFKLPQIHYNFSKRIV